MATTPTSPEPTSPEPTSQATASNPAATSSTANPAQPALDHGRIVAFLGVDSVADAHKHASNLALSHAAAGRTVAHLFADPGSPQIQVSQNPDSPGTPMYDLAGAVREIPTAAGRYIQVSIGGLSRLELADIVEDVSGITDRVLISGPGAALSQESLEFATLAEFAAVIGGNQADSSHVGYILGQLGIPFERVAAERAVRKINPPGRL